MHQVGQGPGKAFLPRQGSRQDDAQQEHPPDHWQSVMV
jgi:hypothetical protein